MREQFLVEITDSSAEDLAAAGLEAEFMPLYGNTPFNNWRIVARRPRTPAAIAQAVGTTQR